MMTDTLRDAELETLEDLEWVRLCAAVVARCRGPRANNISLPIAVTLEGTRIALAETEEALRLEADGEPLPVDGIRDVREHLARLDRMGALDATGLRDLIAVLGCARSLRRFLGARRATCPALFSACTLDPTLDRLEDELRAHVDADGTLADHASPELRRLRTETANLRARVIGKLEELVHRHASVLSDTFYTLRDGRYVLPLRTDSHEKIPGIVHGMSASGATVFVEPESIITQGNRLKLAFAEQEREEVRILGVLSELVRDRLTELVAAIDALDHADLRSAAARFGREFGARVLPLATGPTVDLREARHPLLLLDGARVVPNNLALESGRALVISGPNAGGKTVALKMLGLSALMMRAGLPIPAAEGSSLGFFDTVLSDVGDDQSISMNLSTFSAHVRRLARVMELAGERTMVLLDELAGGTDPEEGAALACAVVDALCRAGAATSVTTHYEPLKAMATRDARLRNASVGFDVERMEPTFTLTLDIPGASSALMVARRFGVPASVVAYAESVLPEHTRSFDELVRKLDARLHEVAVMRAEVEDERRRAAALSADASARLAALEQADAARLNRDTTKLLEQVRRTRDELREARRVIRESRSEAALEVARRSVEAASELAQRVRVANEPVPPNASAASPAIVSLGDRVYVPRLGREADVVEVGGKGKIRVAAGPLKLWVELAELRSTAPVAPRASANVREPESETPRPAMASVDNTLDIRGLRADDAMAMLESFLDRMYGASEPHAFIVHGVGTGALREAVREVLARSGSYVRAHRPGTSDEGGPRLTVVEIR